MPIKLLNYRLTEIAQMIDVSEATVRRTMTDLKIEPVRIPAGASSRPVYSLSQVLQLAKAKRQKHKLHFKRPLIMSVYVPKGGVGKSTISNELSAEFTLQGFNVLDIDLDDQASLSVMMGYQPDEVPDKDKPNPWLVPHTFLSALYPPASGKVTLNDIVREPYGPYGQKLIPADITLGELVYKLAIQANRDLFIRNWFSRNAQSELKDYDIILIDNAPSTSVVSRASIVASDVLLIPVRLDALTVKSIAYLANELNVLSESNLNIPQVVAIPNFFKQNSTRSARVMSALQKEFGEEVPIAPHISDSESFPKSLLYDVGRELEEVLPVTYGNWNRGTERPHQEIRAVANFVLSVVEKLGVGNEQSSLFEEPKKRKRALV